MKTNIYYSTITLFILIFFLSGCDKIDNPMKEGVSVWNGRKIVIYDFTGHRCGNCPNAHRLIDDLTKSYGEAIVPIAIHCNNLAELGTDLSKFQYDFRTEIGAYYGGGSSDGGFYELIGIPTGLVNNLSKTEVKSVGTWPESTAKFITTYPEYLIEIEPGFSPSDNDIFCNVTVTTNINNSRNLSLLVFLLEDNIITWQKDYNENFNNGNEDIQNYVHNHVLRSGFNGPWGDIIKDNNNETSVGDEYNKSYSLKASSNWEVDNCSIVAFVYDTDTKEVLQAEINHLNK